jgi:hypothetical protein
MLVAEAAVEILRTISSESAGRSLAPYRLSIGSTAAQRFAVARARIYAADESAVVVARGEPI